MQTHYIFYRIVKREVSGVRGCDLAQPSRYCDKQFGQTVMVDHEVRHLEQSFVAAKIRLRIDVSVQTQFARPATPLGKRGDYSAGDSSDNTLFLLVPVSGKTRIKDLHIAFCLFCFRERPGSRTCTSPLGGIQVFRTRSRWGACSKPGRKPSGLGGMLHEGELSRQSAEML